MSKLSNLSLRMWPATLALLIPTMTIHIEKVFFPVVKDFTITEMKRTEHVIAISGYMRKIRDCRFAGVTAEGQSALGVTELPLLFKDNERSQASTRPAGVQGWGPWYIEVPINKELEVIELQAVHRCHPMWVSQTKLVTIPVSEIKE